MLISCLNMLANSLLIGNSCDNFFNSEVVDFRVKYRVDESGGLPFKRNVPFYLKFPIAIGIMHTNRFQKRP